mgnify:CR=1 FL=1
MKREIVAWLVVASMMALSAWGKHDDTANTSDTVPGTEATAYPQATPAAPAMPPANASTAPTYPPPATTAGMDNVPPPARTSP